MVGNNETRRQGEGREGGPRASLEGGVGLGTIKETRGRRVGPREQGDKGKEGGPGDKREVVCLLIEAVLYNDILAYRPNS